MGLKFNIFTSNFDYVGSSTIPTYELVITSLSTWGSSVSGNYTLTILASTHGKGTKPLVQCLETTTSTYTLISVAHQIDSSGNITIQVSDTPDNRFLGKILIGD